jgi:hypothetical protein
MTNYLALMLVLAQPALSIPVFATAGSTVSSSASVHIGGQPVITLAMPGAATKAEQIQKNIDNALVATNDRSPATVKVTYVKGKPVITLGGFLVTAVDSQTAAAAHTTPAVLTQKWANELRTALSNKASVSAYLAQLTGTSTPIASNSRSSKSYSPAHSSSASASGRNTQSSGSHSASSSLSPSNALGATSSGASSTGSGSIGSGTAIADNGIPAPGMSPTPYAKARVIFVPAGLVMPLKLNTSISSQVSKVGDTVMAKLTDPVNLGDAVIPADTVITGHVTKASTGTYKSQSGRLGVKFTSIRTPDGVETPITAHIVGSLGSFQAVQEGSDEFRGETGNSKVKKALVDTAIGAGSGAVLGLTIGAISGGERGVGRGMVAGTAFGAGAGLLASYLLKGKDVSVSSEQTVKLQLDQPARFAMASFSGAPSTVSGASTF